LYILWFPIAPYLVVFGLGFLFWFFVAWCLKKSKDKSFEKVSLLTGSALIVFSLFYLIKNLSFIFHGGYIRIGYVGLIVYFIILGIAILTNFKFKNIELAQKFYIKLKNK